MTEDDLKEIDIVLQMLTCLDRAIPLPYYKAVCLGWLHRGRSLRFIVEPRRGVIGYHFQPRTPLII